MGETNTDSGSSYVLLLTARPGGQQGAAFLSFGIRLRAEVASLPRKRPIYSRTTVMRSQIPRTWCGRKRNVELKSKLYSLKVKQV